MSDPNNIVEYITTVDSIEQVVTEVVSESVMTIDVVETFEPELLTEVQTVVELLESFGVELISESAPQIETIETPGQQGPPGPFAGSEPIAKRVHVHVFSAPASYYDVPVEEVAFGSADLIDVYLQGDYQDNFTVPQAQRVTPDAPFQTGDVLVVKANYALREATWISIGEPALGVVLSDPALIAKETGEPNLYDLVIRTS